jgi:RNA recognition motif-containing protein
VGGISPETTEDELRDLFENHGEVLQVFVPMSEQGGNRGFAFVIMSSEDALEAAKELRGKNLNGHYIRVQEAHQRSWDKAKAKGWLSLRREAI